MAESSAVGVDVTARVTINRPVDEVAAWVMDPANDFEWIRALSDSHRVGDAPIGQGMRVSRAAKMMGRPITYVTEVRDYSPRHMVMHTVEGPFPMVVTYRFEETPGGGTAVSVRNQGGKGLAFRMFRPLIGWMVNARVKGDLKQMKKVLESPGSSS